MPRNGYHITGYGRVMRVMGNEMKFEKYFIKPQGHKSILTFTFLLSRSFLELNIIDIYITYSCIHLNGHRFALIINNY